MNEEDALREIAKVITQIDEDDGYLVFYKAKAFDEITEIMQAYTLHKLHSKKPLVMKKHNPFKQVL